MKLFIFTKFNHRSIDEFNLKINLEYGRINYRKLLSIEDNLLNAMDYKSIHDFPILTSIALSLQKKKQLLKIFSVKAKKRIVVLN